MGSASNCMYNVNNGDNGNTVYIVICVDSGNYGTTNTYANTGTTVGSRRNSLYEGADIEEVER